MSDPLSSHVPSEAAGGGQGRQPTEEELRAYLGQLREAPVDQVVAEVSSALLNAAQVKLGRSDARLLLDLAADVSERVRGQVPDELTRQLDDVLAKLRIAQVEAERELGRTDAGEDETAGGESAGEQVTGDSPPEQAAEDPAGGRPPSDGSAASRLWIPGR